MFRDGIGERAAEAPCMVWPLQDIKNDLTQLQDWETDPHHREMIKTVSRVVQGMEIKALGAVLDVLTGGRLRTRTNALHQLYRLWGDTQELGRAAHAIRRTGRMRASFVELVGTHMLFAYGESLERGGVSIHAAKNAHRER